VVILEGDTPRFWMDSAGVVATVLLEAEGNVDGFGGGWADCGLGLRTTENDEVCDVFVPVLLALLDGEIPEDVNLPSSVADNNRPGAVSGPWMDLLFKRPDTSGTEPAPVILDECDPSLELAMFDRLCPSTRLERRLRSSL